MADMNDLKRFGKFQKYAKGQYIFQQGDSGQTMFIILTGKVSVSIHSAVGDNIMLAELAAGNFVGEMSVLESQPRSASVLAIEDTVVLCIEKENFVEFISSKPDWALKVMQSLSNRVRKINERLTNIQMKEEDLNEGLKKVMPQPVIAEGVVPSILPEGHKDYHREVPAEFLDKLFQRNIECPICNAKFNVWAMKTTKLRMDKVTNDFREIHEKFDKLWYNVWVCPTCYYANFYFDFLDIEKRPAEKLYTQLLEFKRTNQFHIDNNIADISQVFVFYYLALNTKKLLKKVDYKVGKMWLNMAWLYQDMEDDEMYRYAYHMAYENYTHVLFHTRVNIQPQEEQRLYILLGEMSLFEGKPMEALKFYQNAIRSDPKSGLADQARDRFYEIKAKRKEDQTESEQ